MNSIVWKNFSTMYMKEKGKNVLRLDRSAKPRPTLVNGKNTEEKSPVQIIRLPNSLLSFSSDYSEFRKH